MVNYTQGEYDAHIAKQSSNRRVTIFPSAQDIQEIGKHGLQQKIQDWCDAQFPRWVYDFPRTDLKSTLPMGRHDATIWGPFPVCFLIETKAKGRKRTIDQLSWAARLRQLGWEVHVIYSLEEFLNMVNPQ